MNLCFFVSDLHGKIYRYEQLFSQIIARRPKAVFIGGDLLPHRLKNTEGIDDFILDYMIPSFINIRKKVGSGYPRVFLIAGNDDPRSEESKLAEGETAGAWEYLHFRKTAFEGYTVCGYSCVPPTPFQLKDWEKYDVSRYVDPGCIPPTEGFRTVAPLEDIEYGTIMADIELLTQNIDPAKTIFLFHTPPYQTYLDRAALDGMMVDHAPLDVHVGSIAVKRFIEEKQPFMTLHGHIHESAKITGHWNQRIGKTIAMNAAHVGNELSLVSFDPDQPDMAIKELL